jgi:signal peptidase I
MIHTTSVSGSLERGDVVVLDDRGNDYALKRIVGLPGETVHIWRGYVFINKKILIEPYLPKRVYTFPRQRTAVFVLGEGQYFVLGDNRPSSSDSRTYGPVERKQVKKRVLMPDTAAKARFGPIKIPDFDNAAVRVSVPKWG